MKILQFGKHYPPDLGGIETVMLELTEALNLSGIRCDVLCANSKAKSVDQLINGYRVVRAASFGKLFSTAMAPALIWKLFKLHKAYDIIHLHMPDPLAVIAMMLVRPRARLVVYWHGDVDFDKFKILGFFYRPLERWIVKRSDHIISPTSAHLDFSRCRQLASDKKSVIPFPFDALRFTSKEIDKSILARHRARAKFIIFTVGRLIYYKGFEFLIKAAKHLPDDHLILIGGGGPLQQSLQNLIESEGVGHKVELLGRISDDLLPTYYQLCDLFCFPSIYKGEMFGMVQLEAMCFGKPIVGTRIDGSGVCEVNIHNETGLTVATKNEFQLAAAIVSLLSDAERYQTISSNCVRRVAEKYDKRVVIAQYIDLYRRLLGRVEAGQLQHESRAAEIPTAHQ